MDKLKELAKIYRAGIAATKGILDHDVHQFGDKTSPNHLLWMLNEIETNPEQTLTKKHRWLGFVQGLMIAYRITDVDSERDRTRYILSGD